MTEPIIKFDGVTKKYKLYKNDKKRLMSTFIKSIKYKEKLAANNLTFSIDRGEAVALFGKNGAGKSTVLKIMTGVTYPTTGEVTVDGRVSALLELTSGFDPEFSGRDNITLKAQLMGVSDKEIKKLEPAIVEFAAIGEYIDQPVRGYSSGMKARLGFAINVNIEPEILIIDEALSVGDAEFEKKCVDRVKSLIEHEHITLLFVTHAIATAKEFCTRGIVMKDGAITFDGDINKAVEFYQAEEEHFIPSI